jgi:HAD superfamily hydrolase (TIGR01509 family)
VNGLPPSIHTVLFDLDGVLTPTALVHAAAWAQVFNDFLRRHDGAGFAPFDPVTDYDRYVDGKPRAEGARDFLAARGIELPFGTEGDPPDAHTVQGLAARKDQIFLEKVERDGVAPYPGSLRYLIAVRAAGMRTAVVSASEHCGQVVRSAGIEHLLDVHVDGLTAQHDHLRGKPQPDTFLAAAQRLHSEPAGAAVFEDAIAGVAAGRAGRFGYVVGVDRVDNGTEHEHADALRANGADTVVRDLAELLEKDAP